MVKDMAVDMIDWLPEGEGDFERIYDWGRGLRSMRGVRSVWSTALEAVVLLVRIDGCDVGRTSGERGGETSGSDTRRR